MLKQYLEIGEIVAVHGLKGDVKVYPWSDTPRSLTRLKKVYLDAEGSKVLAVQKWAVQQNMLLLKWEGTDTVEDARHFIGRTLYAARQDLPLAKGQYFVSDIIGMKAVDDITGVCYGTVTDVSSNGAQDYYEITAEGGKTYYMPAVKEFLAGVDLEKEEIRVTPIKGMFDDED